MTNPIYKNEYERLFLYAKKLGRNKNDNLTIREISTKYEIPLPVVRADVAFLTSSGYLDFVKNNDEDNDEDPNLLQTPILDGEYDKKPIAFYSPSPNKEPFLLSLTREESTALGNFETNLEEPLHDNHFIIKHPVSQASSGTLAKVQELYMIIKDEYNAVLDYDSKKEGPLTLTVHPLKIAYDSIDNVYYLIVATDPSATIKNSSIIPLRINRIKTITPTTDDVPYAPADAERFFEHQSQVWGMNFDCEPENIAKVKVRFYNEADVWNKVRAEIGPRVKDSKDPDTKLYEDGDYLYYEDTVYGIPSFRSWLLSYGSSAIVEEPISLRDKMHQMYQEILQRWSDTDKQDTD